MQEIMEWAASIIGMVAALMIAARYSTRIAGWGFVLFLLGSLLWVATGLSSGNYALAAQNVVLVLINCLGIYRYLIRHEDIS